MNTTDDIICATCQIDNGFSPADRRSIILMVILTCIILALCYASVLWFAIRTRFRPDKKSNVIVDRFVHNNDAFSNEEEHDAGYAQPLGNIRGATTTTQVRFDIENEWIKS